jgi:ribosome-binding factor A
MVAKSRALRIADRIREELSEILIRYIQDPRLSGVSITDVTVDRELSFADVYFSALEGAQRSREILDGFQHAQGFLRSELAHRIKLRVFPRLRFHWDPTFERAERIERLLASLHSDAPSPSNESPSQPKADADE